MMILILKTLTQLSAKIQGNHLQLQQPKHQVKKAREDMGNPQSIKTRVKVKKLNNIKSKKGSSSRLTIDQREYLSYLGFGPLLNTRVDGSASRIGYYVVNNFDPERMVLNVEHGEIPINRQLIHDMLGLPSGNANINSLKCTPAEDKTVDLWSAQFESENDVRTKGVQRAIKRLKDVRLLFKVNFFGAYL
ncbi:unnamed protein product [Lactuca saligna]|uniref:Uncharacterized protein n=1 Tax=Lactuca saligna TaxID=75948 RepID=A0AA35Y8C5_LACSI|nr:unnamed protein product [Lactuca saligna]